MSNLKWVHEDYDSAQYLCNFGKPVIELLEPKAGEKILDIGCGNGILTQELSDLGCDMVGLDSSEKNVEAAKALGLDARLADAEHFHIDEIFDAVISNAALHWMPDQYGVIRGVWRALKPGGRFAAECGGEGCIRIIREGMKIALIKRGLDYKERNPWKYPELGAMAKILENQGFRVSYIARIDKPMPLPNGLKAWLDVFAKNHTRGLDDDDRERFFKEVEDYCRPMLYTEKGGWTADYVRLRFLAVKPLDAE